jgi:Domain of unknown function (DUF222)
MYAHSMLAEPTSAIDGLAETDPHALTDTELHDTVVQLHRLTSRLAAVTTELTSVWDSRMLWASDGSKSSAARLERDCAISDRSAKSSVRRARRLRTMPFTQEAFLDGRLSVDHVDTLCAANQPDFASLFARDEELLVDKALTMDFRKFQKCVTYWKHCADDTRSEEQARKQHQARYLELSRTFQGSVDVRGLLDPVNGTIVSDELERLEQIMFKKDWGDARTEHGDSARPEHLFRSAGQRRADALVEMARRSAAMTTSHRPARPLVSVLIGVEDVRRARVRVGRRHADHTGPSLALADRRRCRAGRVRHSRPGDRAR